MGAGGLRNEAVANTVQETETFIHVKRRLTADQWCIKAAAYKIKVKLAHIQLSSVGFRS